MLQSLPAEAQASILSHLGPPDLASCTRVSSRLAPHASRRLYRQHFTPLGVQAICRHLHPFPWSGTLPLLDPSPPVGRILGMLQQYILHVPGRGGRAHPLDLYCQPAVFLVPSLTGATGAVVLQPRVAEVSLLSIAAHAGAVDVVHFLLANGARPGALARYGPGPGPGPGDDQVPPTALFFATAASRPRAVAALLASGMAPGRCWELALATGSASVVSALLDHEPHLALSGLPGPAAAGSTVSPLEYVSRAAGPAGPPAELVRALLARAGQDKPGCTTDAARTPTLIHHELLPAGVRRGPGDGAAACPRVLLQGCPPAPPPPPPQQQAGSDGDEGAAATCARLTSLPVATRLPFPSDPSSCLLYHVFVRAPAQPSRLSVLPPWARDDVQLEARSALVRWRGPDPAALFMDHCITAHVDDDLVARPRAPPPSPIGRLVDLHGLAVRPQDRLAQRQPVGLAVLHAERNATRLESASLAAHLGTMARWHEAQFLAADAALAPVTSTVATLAGVIIQGPEWLLVYTRRSRGGRLTMAPPTRLGSLDDASGALGIIRALSEVRRWVEQELAPAYAADLRRAALRCG